MTRSQFTSGPVAEAERAGVVHVRGDLVAFRHELARRAVAESLPASVRLERNAEVLRALLGHPDSDPFRVLHHAVEAGDDATVIAYGEARPLGDSYQNALATLDGQDDPGMIGRETVPVLARVLVRQGSADAPEWLALAARHAATADVLEWLVPAGLAHIEHAWLAVGDPYEHALALAESGQVEPAVQALTILDGLGAGPAVALVRRRLRGLGVAGLPRRPQPGTLTNPAGLAAVAAPATAGSAPRRSRPSPTCARWRRSAPRAGDRSVSLYSLFVLTFRRIR